MNFTELHTQRLELVEIKAEHGQRLYDIFSKEEATRYYGMDAFKSVEQAANLIHSFQKMFSEKRAVRWGIVLKENNSLIGTIGLNNLQLWNKRTEIGYDLHPDFWRKGYVSEALQEVLRHVFEDLGLHRAGAVTFPDNEASSSLLKKLSFKEEGLLRGYIFQGGRSHDACVFSLLKPEWETLVDHKEQKVSTAT
ncbi:ribosomal-protein-alanine N-acetyltransferase [Peribacillus deserti]|uniref:Ribosomal-protein-alanine N-acetyltransferase n=1 Tax=Peribacillus deserti TaxID=673318 RepID=A0ABS2QKG5_9BACI|nr:GNAT family protein [Peribacillus deserti]MBM7693643.1 ribosomal-protein-alanine N-acetyltransferase [Peribacillus deserti]